MTVLPAPTVGVSNVAGPHAHVTTSPAITPLSVHPVTVAGVVPSYTLFAAVTVAVRTFAVMLAVVVALVADSA